MYSQKNLSVTAVVALIIGVAFGLFFSSKSPVQLGGGLSATQLEKLKMMFPPVSEMRSFSGTVKKVGGEAITLEIDQSYNPFDEWQTSRQVTVTDSTKIVKISQKSPAEFQKETEAYLKAVNVATGSSTKPFLAPPASEKEENIKLSDIKVGDNIVVEADHNIKNEETFTATRISVH